MTVRAKFQCQRVEDYGQSKKAYFIAIYQGDAPAGSENARFTKATPWGELAMTIDNPAAAVQIVPGRCYYLDFTEAPSDDWNRWAYPNPVAEKAEAS